MLDNPLLLATIEVLQNLALKVTPVKAPRGVNAARVDAWLRLDPVRPRDKEGLRKEGLRYGACIKRHITTATLGALLTQLHDQAAAAACPVLLVADYIAPTVAEVLRQQRQAFVDTAGNLYLEAPGLLLYVTGRKRQAEHTAAKADPTFTTAGLKILFVLLCQPELVQAPQRLIAATAGVALGAVPAVLAQLQLQGHLLTINKQRQFNANKRLLDEWALTYARRLRPKTLQALYTTLRFDTWRTWKLDAVDTRWGGEPAAALLTNYLQPGVLTLYAERLTPRLIVEQKLVKTERTIERASEQAVVEVRQPFWGKMLQTQARPDIVPPVLVYADLLATGDGRCLETAHMVYDDYLARFLPAA